MILGMVTAASILILLLVSGLKIWNVFNKGSKYSWHWVAIGFVLSILAFAGLFQSLMINYYAADQDEFMETSFIEANAYFTFGFVAFMFIFMLTIIEAFIAVGLIVSPELGVSHKDEEKKRGFFSFGGK
jgi:hypothetical protein